MKRGDTNTIQERQFYHSYHKLTVCLEHNTKHQDLLLSTLIHCHCWNLEHPRTLQRWPDVNCFPLRSRNGNLNFQSRASLNVHLTARGKTDTLETKAHNSGMGPTKTENKMCKVQTYFVLHFTVVCTLLWDTDKQTLYSDTWACIHWSFHSKLKLAFFESFTGTVLHLH